ncbi:hypothetical protein BC829DRAFT_36205 [Chytridium lagenaria]|nr:hypothetical protein BC829DRAFT_36205 [Chytridium lagenaria]
MMMWSCRNHLKWELGCHYCCRGTGCSPYCCFCETRIDAREPCHSTTIPNVGCRRARRYGNRHCPRRSYSACGSSCRARTVTHTFTHGHRQRRNRCPSSKGPPTTHLHPNPSPLTAHLPRLPHLLKPPDLSLAKLGHSKSASDALVQANSGNPATPYRTSSTASGVPMVPSPTLPAPATPASPKSTSTTSSPRSRANSQSSRPASRNSRRSIPRGGGQDKKGIMTCLGKRVLSNRPRSFCKDPAPPTTPPSIQLNPTTMTTSASSYGTPTAPIIPPPTLVVPWPSPSTNVSTSSKSVTTLHGRRTLSILPPPA